MSSPRKYNENEYAPDSKWEIYDMNQISPEVSKQVAKWEAIPPSSISNDSILTSLMKSPFRVGSDILSSGYETLKKIPEYYQSAKKEVPGIYHALQEHPLHTLGQAGAGLAEMGQKTFNLPHDISQYATERLHLIPENINQMIQMGRMPEDTQAMINQTFGEPKYAGEKLIRGLFRNAPEITTAKGTLSYINPLRYTSKNIAKNVVKTGEKQYLIHQKQYNKLWDKADRQGFNNVTFDQQRMNSNFNTIQSYKTPREYQSLENFMQNPTLSNAQKAQSDMGIIKRNMEEKSRKGSLNSEEKALYQAAKDAEKHIESNMFKDRSGNINKALKNQYDKISTSYRKNVVPYKYNEAIQAYKAQEMLPSELTSSLRKGEFAAKKGHAHPELFRPQNIKNALITAGLAEAGLIGAKNIYDYLYGTK